jgi:iron(III) transport system substrate-binding protein
MAPRLSSGSKSDDPSPQGLVKFSAWAALVLVSCFFSRPSFCQQPNSQAQDEKRLVVYHSTGIEDTQQLLAHFRKRYPNIQVENHRLSSPKLFQRITAEVRAGRNLADAYLISGLQTWLLKDMGLLTPYISPERNQIKPALRDRQGYWTGALWNLGVFAYNTRMAAAEAVPKKWVFLQHLMGKEKASEFMVLLSRQQPQVRSGHNLVAQLLTAGEFALAPTARVHRIEEAKKEGAPVEWIAIEPLAPEPPVCVSLPKNAPRPNAGKLFIDFALSSEAQELFYRLKRIPSRMDTPQPIPRLSQIKLLEIEYDQEVKNYGLYAKEYRDLLGVR